jgi:hypothetical protein
MGVVRILLWVRLKLLQAAPTAEVVMLVLKVELEGCSTWVNRHATYGVDFFLRGSRR